MFRVYMSALLLWALSADAKPVSVTVKEEIGGRPDEVVRQSARVKAQWSAIDRLPVVVSGSEQLKDDDYSQEIKALSAGESTVTVSSEVWDRNNGILTLSADVTMDSAKSLELIEEIRLSVEARARLKEVYNKIDAIAAAGMVNQPELIQVESERARILSEFLIRDNIAASQAATQDLYTRVGVYLYTGALAKYISDAKVTILNVDDEYVNARVEFNKTWAQVLNEFQGEFSEIPTIVALWDGIKSQLPTPCISKREWYPYAQEWRAYIEDEPRVLGSAKDGYHYLVRARHQGKDVVLNRVNEHLRVSACVSMQVFEAVHQ
ncbi:hypothetical protein [Rheinheimera hassiensis]|uniref:hypothetical protein n=1 Tax=Rheinheimera hassiensis TaxID=1193627 RepID=UPI001F055C67|nr:hypothetical protein [Rheinheimera hassiensis]